MEISDTLIADKNKEIVSLRTCLKQRTGEIQKMKFNEEPTQEKLLLVSAELSHAQNEKAKLWSKVIAAALDWRIRKLRQIETETLNSNKLTLL